MELSNVESGMLIVWVIGFLLSIVLALYATMFTEESMENVGVILIGGMATPLILIVASMALPILLAGHVLAEVFKGLRALGKCIINKMGKWGTVRQ